MYAKRTSQLQTEAECLCLSYIRSPRSSHTFDNSNNEESKRVKQDNTKTDIKTISFVSHTANYDAQTYINAHNFDTHSAIFYAQTIGFWCTNNRFFDAQTINFDAQNHSFDEQSGRASYICFFQKYANNSPKIRPWRISPPFKWNNQRPWFLSFQRLLFFLISHMRAHSHLNRTLLKIYTLKNSIWHVVYNRVENIT